MPYALIGYQHTFLTNRESLIYWDRNSDDWATLNFDGYNAFVGHAGIRLSINIWYPLQLMIAADYNYATKDKEYNQIIERHDMDRVNFYAGFRLHF